MARDPRRLPIYRSLHASPLLGGVPIYLFFALFLAGCLGVFGAFAVLGRSGGLAMMGAVGLSWGAMAFIYAQDRVRVPLLLIRWLYPVSRRISSYSPSQERVVVVEERR